MLSAALKSLKLDNLFGGMSDTGNIFLILVNVCINSLLYKNVR